MSKFQVGDVVKVVGGDGTYFPVGSEVKAVFVEGPDYTGSVSALWTDGTDEWWMHDDNVCALTEQQDIYLVSGYASEFPTQEAAEDYVKSIGSNGEEYRIAKLVRTVKVSRVTTISLEAV